MRKSLLLLAVIWSAQAYAQPPERVVPEAALSIAVGQSESLRFPEAFGNIAVATQGIVQATAQSDHVLTLFGQAVGDTIVTVSSKDGRELWSSAVSITQEPGHVVRLYGGKNPDFQGFYCTNAACGRADKELNGARDLSSVTTVAPGGTAITRTYGR